MASIQYKTAKAGKRTYYVVVSQAGRHKWIRAGTQREARILKREVDAMEESQRLEKLGLGQRQKRIDAFFQEYLDHVRLRTAPNTAKRYRAAINAFIAYLQLFKPRLTSLSDIKAEHIEEFMQRRLESVELKALADGDKNGNHRQKQLPKPQTVNYEVSVLRSAFMWAQDRDLVSRVPTRRVKKLRPQEKKQARILSVEECKLLIKTARELAKGNRRYRVYAKAIEFLLNTGLRAGELCNLTWDDIDLENGIIQIRAKPGWTPKSYAREFFLNERCLKILGSIREKDEHVFEAVSGRQLKTDDLRKALIKIARAAGIDGLTRVHDLRHTFNSHMQMNGVDAPTMARILGHRDLSTTMIYTHQTQEHLKKSIEKIGIG